MSKYAKNKGKPCSVDACHSEATRKGFCQKHYRRNKDHGSPLITGKPSGNTSKGKDHNMFKHGMAGCSEYRSWSAMKARCYRESSPDYKNYGARGIVVCDRWRSSFENFLEDMGERPKGLTLERIDTNGDYEPSNCVWADRTTQTRNRRYTKLTQDIAKRIRAQRLAGSTFRQLSEQFSISASHAKRVCDGNSWA